MDIYYRYFTTMQWRNFGDRNSLMEKRYKLEKESFVDLSEAAVTKGEI